MTRSRSIQQSPAEPRRKGRAAKGPAAPPADTTEMVLAELRVRRERLQQLLQFIHTEANRGAAARKPSQPRHLCSATLHDPEV